MRSANGPGRRLADLQDIAGIDGIPVEIDARTKKIQQRTATALAARISRQSNS